MYYVSDNDWSSSHNYDYWNKNFTSATNVNNTAAIKTIYDPSISSFTIPKTAAFSNFSAVSGYTSNSSNFNVSGSFNKGWNFYTNGWKSGGTIFFEAFGFRDVYSGRTSGDGSIAFMSVRGCYWTAGANSVSQGRDFYFNSSAVYPQAFDRRSHGQPIRSVSE